MTTLKNFMSGSYSAAESATLDLPQPDFAEQRAETYAAFEREQQSVLQVAEASPLVRWAVVELLSDANELPRRLDGKTRS